MYCESAAVVASVRARQEFLSHHHGYCQGAIGLCTERGWWYLKWDTRKATGAAGFLHCFSPKAPPLGMKFPAGLTDLEAELMFSKRIGLTQTSPRLSDKDMTVRNHT